MTAGRARAYRRLMRELRVLGPAKLCDAELSHVRDAADALVLAGDRRRDPAVSVALAGLADVATSLQAGGHWSRSHLRRFLEDVLACGPDGTRALPLVLPAQDGPGEVVRPAV